MALKRIAERHGLAIVEDACQAHGARRDDRRAGAAGIVGAFSFYPSMNLGAFGDSGAVVTNDDEIAAQLRALREHKLYHRPGAFPVSERLTSEVLSLPIFPGIREEQLAAVVDAIIAYFERG